MKPEYGLKSYDGESLCFKAASSLTPPGMLGYLEGYVASIGTRDSVDEVCPPGCFDETLENEGKKGLIKLFYNHKVALGTAEPPPVSYADEKGLFLAGHVAKTPAAESVVGEIGTVARHASFAYLVRGCDEKKAEDGSTHLTRVTVREGGPAIWPVNRHTPSMAMLRKAMADVAGMVGMDGAEMDAEDPAAAAMAACMARLDSIEGRLLMLEDSDAALGLAQSALRESFSSLERELGLQRLSAAYSELRATILTPLGDTNG